MDVEFVQIITTINSKTGAEEIARALLEKRLAACVQIISPVISSYWWNDKIETDEEWLLFIKTKKNLFERLSTIIKELHPYENPELIMTPIIKGSKQYLDWLNKELTK